MTKLVEVVDRKFYPAFTKHWDDSIFRDRILRYLNDNSVVLDVRAGAGIVPQMDFRGKVARICGIDLDNRVVDNPLLDEGKLAGAESIPYEDDMFDVVFADNVMEHLEYPEDVFREIRRVLKPGGWLLFKTPNRSHYMPLIARITPYWFHRSINKKRGRAEEDTFPTLYRANSVSQVQAIAEASGLTVESIELIEGRPEYLRINFLFYLLGLLYERIVNLTPFLARFRVLLIAQLKKPESG